MSNENTNVIGASNARRNAGRADAKSAGAQVRRIAVDYRGWDDHFPVVILKATAQLSKMSPSISCTGIGEMATTALLGHQHGGQDKPHNSNFL